MTTKPEGTEVIDGYERRRRAIRRRILDVTAKVIREQGDTKISTRAIAELAEVSLATPFNHFKSKNGILAAIVEDSLNKDGSGIANLEHKPKSVVDVLLNISRFYVADAKLFRPLFRAVLTQNISQSASFQMALENLELQLQKDMAAGLIVSNTEPRILAEQIEIFWLGTLVLWCGGAITTEEWLGRVQHGVASILAMVTTEEKKISTRKRRLLERSLTEIK